MKRLIIALALGSIGIAARGDAEPLSLLAAAAAAAAAGAADAKSDDAAYTAGAKALNESRWTDAVTSFDQVIAAKGHRADAALYWKSYALGKLGKRELGDATCQQLHTAYPESTWNVDCLRLQATYLQGRVNDSGAMDRFNFHFDADSDEHTSGARRSSKDPDEEIKILALNSLLHRDPAQALPLLRGILTGNGNPNLKQHAMFVLGQSRSPEGLAMMRDLILGKMGPDLQHQSIQAAGIYEGRRLNDALLEVYRGTADRSLKAAVVSAFFISGDDARMVELARGEKNLEMKRTIVAQLSLMNGKAANDYILDLLK